MWVYAVKGANEFGNYAYTFAPPFQRSKFSLMPDWFQLSPGALGAHPSPVIINGHYVACSLQPRAFLATGGDAAGTRTFGCLTPL